MDTKKLSTVWQVISHDYIRTLHIISKNIFIITFIIHVYILKNVDKYL